MDFVTHAASGVIAALACPNRPRTAWAVPLAALAAAAPDADIFVAPLPLDFLLLHRGITHAFAALPIMGLILALCMYPYWRKSSQGAWSLGKTWLFATALVLLHIFLDCVTTYGTMAFLPFSDYRVRLNGIFIIDIALLLPLLAGIYSAFKCRGVALGLLLWIVLYPSVCVALRIQHEDTVRTRLATEGVQPVQLVVLPDAFAPFFWRVIYQVDTPYIPSPQAPSQKTDFIFAPAAQTHILETDFAFAPAAQTVWHQGLNYRGAPRTTPYALPAANTHLMDSLRRQSRNAQSFFAFTLMPVQQERPYKYIQGQGEGTEYRFYDLRFGSDLPRVRTLLSLKEDKGILFQLQARQLGTLNTPDTPDIPSTPNTRGASPPPTIQWSAVRLIFAGANRMSQWHEPVPPAPPNWWQWLTGYHSVARAEFVVP